LVEQKRFAGRKVTERSRGICRVITSRYLTVEKKIFDKSSKKILDFVGMYN